MEEPMAYFYCYDTGCIENEAPNNCSTVAFVFVAAVNYILVQSRCLAKTGDKHTEKTEYGRDSVDMGSGVKI